MEFRFTPFYKNIDFGSKIESWPKKQNMRAYLIRTSGVPLKYHHPKNLEKTKGKPVPLEYHYSTSIFEVDPCTDL